MREDISLAEFLDEFKDAIARTIVEEYPSLYSPEKRDTFQSQIADLLRPPYPAQLDTINAIALTLQNQPSSLIVGEMGTGKTLISIAVAHFLNLKRILVVCPPHLVDKWRREIKDTLDGTEIYQLKTIKDMYHIMPKRFGEATRQEWYILSRERAKLSYQWVPAYMKKKVKVEDGKFATFLHCPSCGRPLLGKDEIPLTIADLSRKKQTCSVCTNPLWQAQNNGTRRYALAEFIKKRFKNFFDLLILDECHEYKAKGSAQGYAAGILASVSKKTLALTGTLFGGYSSTLFYLLYRLTHDFKKDFGYSEETKWVNQFGIIERVTRINDDNYADNISSRGRRYNTTIRERPGISPIILPNYLLDKAVFIRLADLALNLPPYTEHVIDCKMLEEQAEAYEKLQSELIAELRSQLAKGNKSLLGAYLQSLLSYPDRCYEAEEVRDPQTNEVIASAPALDEHIIYPKEEKLIELCQREKEKARKVLIYATHTNLRDITRRLARILEDNGLKAMILKSNTVKSEKREKWIKDNLANMDVLIANPRLVQTGLDLVDFPTIIFQEIEYSVYTLRQASRRSWRIGQREPVMVYFLVYTHTIQEQGLKLIALKHKSSLAIEGELLDDGLAAYNVSDNDLFYQLAKNIVDRIEIEESIDNLWVQVQSQEKEICQGLVDIPIPPPEEISRRPSLDDLYLMPTSKKRSSRRRAVDPNQLTLWPLTP